MQPREKFQSKGEDALTEVELVAILVGSGIKGRDYRKLASSILKVVKDSFPERPGLDELTEVRGVGSATAVRILAAIELGYRLYAFEHKKLKRITTTEKLVGELDDIKSRTKEYMKAYFLNARMELIGDEVIAVGQLNCLHVKARDIIAPALQSNAYAVALAHNHPSGDPEPSQNDIESTREIKDGCDLVGLVLVDHVVITANEWRSIQL